jgi:hypothetical protein
MADPLSVTASILSVVDAAGKLISLIKKVKNADNIKCALLNEVSELKFVLDLIAGSENPPQDPSQSTVSPFEDRGIAEYSTKYGYR